MDQEKFGELIKNIRKKNNLTQKQLADKYNVTYQAVSKWETGKNMPDITLIKRISEDFDISLEEMFLGEKSNNKGKSKKGLLIKIGIGVLLVIAVIAIVMIFKKDNDFQFKTLSTSCDNFKITGSISYNYQKSAIFISSIDYCGEEDKTKYDKIECILYENNGDIKNEISSYKYNKNNKISLEEFLKEVRFSVDNYNQVCKKYHKDSLNLEIKASVNNKNISYDIPLVFDDNCKS